MPIYEYQCQACNERVEILQKISDEPVKKCPHCKKNKLTRLISAAGFRLKGSGWYETDFKSGSKKNLHGAESTGSKSDSSSKSESSSATSN